MCAQQIFQTMTFTIIFIFQNPKESGTKEIPAFFGAFKYLVLKTYYRRQALIKKKIEFGASLKNSFRQNDRHNEARDIRKGK